MILLQASQVARRFGADTLFSHVNLEIQDHARVALVGRNGAGKSTLLKMIAENNEPDEGAISMKRDLSIGYLAQDQGLDSHNSIYDEMLTAFDGVRALEASLHDLEGQMADSTLDAEQQAQIAKIYDQTRHDFEAQNGYGYDAEIRGVLHGFGFDAPDYTRSITELSGGQRTQLALAKLLLERHDLLILDEPTNHLDVETLTWLEGYLKSYQGALLIVSHDRYFLDHVVTEVVDMDHGTATHFKGNYSKFMELKAAMLEQEWKAYSKQQAKISDLEDFVNKNIVRASTTKRAQSRRKQLEKMQRIEKPKNEDGVARISFSENAKSGDIVLTVKDASIGYPNVTLADHVTVDVNRQHIVAIVGQNGVGKSTLLKSVLGKLPFKHGEAKLGTGVSLGYYDQDQSELHDHKTVLSELWDDHPTTPERDIRTILGSFLFSGPDVDKLVHNLSGGERARLLLTKLAMRHDNFLMLDEPTNHLDIDSREVLENALNEFDGTILLVSHDRYFINQVATEVVELTAEGTTLYLGDYDYYVNKKEEQEMREQEALAEVAATKSTTTSATTTPTAGYHEDRETQREKRRLQRQVDQLEAEMESLDQQHQAIEAEMLKPENATDMSELTQLQKQLDELSNQMTTTEADWEKASLNLEALN